MWGAYFEIRITRAISYFCVLGGILGRRRLRPDRAKNRTLYISHVEITNLWKICKGPRI